MQQHILLKILQACWRTSLCLMVLAFMSATPYALPSESPKEVKIAVLALRGHEEAHAMWDATASYLSRMIPEYTFSLVPYDFKHIVVAAERGEYDFVITNSSIYVELEALYGVTSIATLNGRETGQASRLFGGVIFCKKDRNDIRELKDLKNKNFAAVDETSFGGWRMAWRELNAAGMDPAHDFKKLDFAGTHDAVVYAVRDGKADAGTVRTGILEDMAREDKINLADLKIINLQTRDGFNLLHSTRLYPEWPFARLIHTDDALTKKVLSALLSIRTDDEAAKTAKSAGWLPPLNYSGIHELFRELKIGPYKDYGKITGSMVLKKYRYPIAGGLACSMLLAAFVMLLLRLNNKLTRSNVALADAHREVEDQRNILLIEQEKQRELFAVVEKAKRQWEVTMDNVDDLVILADTGFRIERCNRAMQVFSGLPYAQILGQQLPVFFPGLVTDQNKLKGNPFEYCHIPAGRWFHVAICRANTGDADGMVVTLHDMTEIKKVSAELERKNQEISDAKQELQLAVDEISSLIQQVVLKDDLGTYFVNEFPMSCYEMKQCGCENCPCFGKQGMRCWQVAGTFCGGKVQGEFASKYPSCSECNYFKAMTANPLTMIGEQFNNMMHILEGKAKALTTAYSDLKATQGHLLQQEKMASIGQLAAGVAHEINNPVGFIASNLNALQKYSSRLAEYINLETELITRAGNEELNAKQAEGKKKYKVDFVLSDINDLVRESQDGCERVKKIVQDLKGFSRVDQAKQQTVDIHECLDTTLNIVWNELKYKAKIEKDYRARTPITSFPQQLNQVFMNILVNAVHAIDQQGVITIRTWEDEIFLSVAITDTGCGIPPENMGRIFEPFFTTKEVGKGTGLGLSIVYDIVTKNHRGEILVDSHPGQGTTFTVKLPFEGAATN